MQPTISVLLPVYNSDKYIHDCIQSILNQSFNNFELILIDDGSTDSSLKIMRWYAARDNRIIILPQKNLGLSAALNAGIAISRCDYCARIDADDIALPNRLELQLKFMNSHPNIAVVGGWVKIFGENCWSRIWKNPITPGEIYLTLFLRNALFHPTVMFRKSRVKAVGGYDTSVVYDQDYDLWLRMSRNGDKFANIPKVLTRYRIHPAQMGVTHFPSTRIDWMKRNLKLALTRIDVDMNDGIFREILQIIIYENSSGGSRVKFNPKLIQGFINEISPFIPDWVEKQDLIRFATSVISKYIKLTSIRNGFIFLCNQKSYNQKYIYAFFIGIIRKVYKEYFKFL